MNRKTSKLFLSFFTELMGGKKKSSVGLRELGSVLQMFSFCSIGVLGWHVHFPACPPHLMTAQDLESCVPFGDTDIQPSAAAPTPTYSRAPSVHTITGPLHLLPCPLPAPPHCCAWPPTLLSLLESDSPRHTLVQRAWETGKRNPQSQGC